MVVGQAEDLVPALPVPAPAAPVPVGPLQAGGLQVSSQQIIVIFNLTDLISVLQSLPLPPWVQAGQVSPCWSSLELCG